MFPRFVRTISSQALRARQALRAHQALRARQPLRRLSCSLGLVSCLAIGAVVLGAGCRVGQSPQLQVLGIHEEPRHDVVFVQVTNPASHPMRLTKLEYTFAAAGETVSEGEMALSREVPAGAAIVVEIPLESPSEKPMTLSGKLTAELDQIIQIFSVSAQVAPAPSAPATESK